MVDELTIIKPKFNNLHLNRILEKDKKCQIFICCKIHLF